MLKEEFIGKCVSELLKDDFRIDLRQQNTLAGNVGGSFTSVGRSFAVAMKNPASFEIFVHEYSHYQQWKADSEKFDKALESCGKVQEWLCGANVKNIGKYFKDVIALEHDCELKAVKIIQDFSLAIDVIEYKKGANAYLFSHLFSEKHRRKSLPYTNKMIVDCMPTEIMTLDFYFQKSNIPRAAIKEYEKDFVTKGKK